jgi:hypothetical protein
MQQELDKRFFFPKVLQVVPASDYKVYCYLNDGSVRIFDAESLIEKGTVFEKLADKNYFIKTLTVMNETLAWDIEGNRDPCKCIDIDPFSIFENPPIEDPLKES